MLKLLSYAKLNLGLCLLGKRSDGFHELETLMHEIDLCDTIEIEPAEKTVLYMNGEIWDEKIGSNLILEVKGKVEDLLGESLGEWKIHLKKEIPMGSGMGGGSSNGICFLNYLQSLSNSRLTESHVDQIAASLGSDTNFFINGGSAICRGRGEDVQLLNQRRFYFILVFPPLFCSTPAVFKHVMPEFEVPMNWAQVWSERFDRITRNDLEAACQKAYPEMRSWLNELREVYPKICLSGSGSTMFTIHEEQRDRDYVYEELKRFCAERAQVVKAQSFIRA